MEIYVQILSIYCCLSIARRFESEQLAGTAEQRGRSRQASARKSCRPSEAAADKDKDKDKERGVSVDLRVLHPGHYLERHLSDILMRSGW